MKDYSLYDKALIVDKGFPVQIFECKADCTGPLFTRHWHEQLEILFFKSGTGMIECNLKNIEVSKDDIVVLNSNDLHFGHCLQLPLEYYCIIIDTPLLKSSIDGSCEQKYINPIFQNLILFQNKICKSPEIIKCVGSIIEEYENKAIGFELQIKSLVYNLVVMLLRNHVEKVLRQNEYAIRIRNLERLNLMLEYIENNFSRSITIDELADMCHLSRYHFCHLFKKHTGKTVSEYVNLVRINKAEHMLENTDMYIHEIGTAIGFNDTNYFSRTYKKFKNISPALAKKRTSGLEEDT